MPRLWVVLSQMAPWLRRIIPLWWRGGLRRPLLRMLIPGMCHGGCVIGILRRRELLLLPVVKVRRRLLHLRWHGHGHHLRMHRLLAIRAGCHTRDVRSGHGVVRDVCRADIASSLEVGVGLFLLPISIHRLGGGHGRIGRCKRRLPWVFLLVWRVRFLIPFSLLLGL